MPSIFAVMLSAAPVLMMVLTSSTGQDPCENFTSIGSEKRSVKYVFDERIEKPLREQIIDENTWYSFEARTGGEIPEMDQVDVNHCGTDSPIYIKRNPRGRRYHDIAKEKNYKRAVICANYGQPGNPCSWNSTIVIRYCPRRSAQLGKDVFVYKLRRPERCEVSYCAGELDACPPGYTWNEDDGRCTDYMSRTISAVEPCTDFIELGDERRSVKSVYKRQEGSAICDHDIDEDKWYSFEARTGGKIPEVHAVKPFRCGTESPVYIKPRDGGRSYHGIAKRTQRDTDAIVCSNYGVPDNACSWTSTIVIRYCANRSAALGHDTFVYKLRRPDGCSVAYCAGTMKGCPNGLIWSEELEQCIDPNCVSPPTVAVANTTPVRRHNGRHRHSTAHPSRRAGSTRNGNAEPHRRRQSGMPYPTWSSGV